MSEQISVPDLAESIVRTEWHQFQQARIVRVIGLLFT